MVEKLQVAPSSSPLKKEYVRESGYAKHSFDRSLHSPLDRQSLSYTIFDLLIGENHGRAVPSYPVLNGGRGELFEVSRFPKNMLYSMGSYLELRIEFPNHLIVYNESDFITYTG